MKLPTDISQACEEADEGPLEVRLGPWTIEHEFARGGMGVVYRVRHERSGIPAAVKMMTWTRASDPEYRKRFEDEVRSAARLTHPGVIDIYDYGDLSEWSVRSGETGIPPSGPFLVMELARHGGLHQRNEPPEWPVARGIIAGVLDSLAHAHARGVVHRDLKPANILFGRDTNQQLRVKLSDFGLAFVFETLPDSVKEDGMTGGTPTYMAPEQFRSNWREYGPWTDLYGLGCVAWELICGEPPYIGDTPLELAVQHTREDLPEFEPQMEVPEGTEAWLRRILAKEPIDRYRFAADALRELPTSNNPAEKLGLRLLDAPELDEESRDTDEIATYPTLGTLGHESSGASSAPHHNAYESTDKSTALNDISAFTDEHAEPASMPPPPDVDPPDDWRPPEVSDDLPPARRYAMTAVGLELAPLRELPVVGRGEQRDDLWQHFLDVVDSGERQAVAINGPLGIGKSRLARWLRERTQELGVARGLKAQWPEDGRTSSRSGLSRMLRDVLNVDGASPETAAERIERWFDRHPSPETGEGATVDPLMDRQSAANDQTHQPLTHVVAAVMNWLVTDPPTRYRRIQLRSADQRAAVAARFVERISARRPVVLQIDDPHTDEARAFLRELRTVQQPLLVVVTADASRLADDEHLQTQLKELTDTHFDLTPLEEKQLEFLVGRLLSLSAALAGELTHHADGNPRLAVDTIKSWAARGMLEPGPDGFELVGDHENHVSEDIPETVRGQIAPILEDHSEPFIRAVELAAIGGTTISEASWRSACRRASLPFPEDLIDRLSRAKILRRESGEYRFSNALARKLLIDRCREEERFSDFHSTWADICRYENAAHERVSEHLIHAGRPREALDPLVAAMRESGDRKEIPKAIRCLERLGRIIDELNLPEPHPAHVHYLIYRAHQARDLPTNLNEALEFSRRAYRAAKNNDDEALSAEALITLCRVADDAPNSDVDVESKLSDALSLISPQEHPSTWTDAITAKVSYLIFSEGRTDEGMETMQDHMHLADSLPPEAATTLYKFHARAAYHVGDFDGALDSVDAGLGVAREHDLDRTALPFFNIAATIHSERGELRRAEKIIKQTLKHARSITSAESVTFELTLVDILMSRGKYREAYEHASQLPSFVKDKLEQTYPHVFSLLIANAACRLGFWDEARDYLHSLADSDNDFSAATPEIRRMMLELLEAASDHPDTELIAELENNFESVIEQPLD